jgi:methyl-accepting chemotaxis protein
MFRWFRSRASVRLKLKMMFGTLSSLLALAVGLSAGEYFKTNLFAGAGSVVLLRDVIAESGLTLVTVTGAAFAVSVVLGLIAGGAVVGPIESTVSRLEDLAAGEFDAPIQFADYEDETGRMARAMLALRDSSKAVRRLEEELTDQRRQNRILVDVFSSVHAAHREAPAPAPRPQPPARSEPRLVVDNMPGARFTDADREDALLGLLALFGRTRRP